MRIVLSVMRVLCLMLRVTCCVTCLALLVICLVLSVLHLMFFSSFNVFGESFLCVFLFYPTSYDLGTYVSVLCSCHVTSICRTRACPSVFAYLS